LLDNGPSSSDLLRSIERASFSPVPPHSLVDEAPAPPRWWGNHLRELRWQAELARLLIDPIYRCQGIPAGTGAPVLVIPGFLAGDTSLAIMRDWLRRARYAPHPSEIQVNIRCSDQAADRLDAVLARAYGSSGRRVALIGHSRGGHFAKALARRHPERVAAVISMGAGLDSPFDISVPTKMAVGTMRAVHARTSAGSPSAAATPRRAHAASDGTTAPSFRRRFRLHRSTPRATASCAGPPVWCLMHAAWRSRADIGLAFNREVYRVLAETLAKQTAQA